MGKSAFIFPGGLQSVGIGKDLYIISRREGGFEQAEFALGYAPSKHCFSGDEAELQPQLTPSPRYNGIIAALQALSSSGSSEA